MVNIDWKYYHITIRENSLYIAAQNDSVEYLFSYFLGIVDRNENHSTNHEAARQCSISVETLAAEEVRYSPSGKTAITTLCLATSPDV